MRAPNAMSRRLSGSTRACWSESKPAKPRTKRPTPAPDEGSQGTHQVKYAALVLKNLTRNKRRTILTVLSIAVSLFIFSALASMPAVVNQFLADSASSTRVAVHNKAGVTYGIPEAYKQRVVATPHVVAATAQSWFGGIYHEVSDQFPNMSVDPEAVGE